VAVSNKASHHLAKHKDHDKYCIHPSIDVSMLNN